MKSLIIPCLFALLSSVLLPAADVIWISPAGRDDAAGTEAEPFATLDRARLAVRSLVEKGVKGDVIIRLRPGVYPLKATVEFTAADLDVGDRTVTVSADSGGRAVIVGSRELRGTWRRIEGNLWSLPLPEAAGGKWIFRSLFRDGRWTQRAIEPDEGHYTPVEVEADRTRLTLNEVLPAAWTGLRGVEVNSIAHWHFNRQPVAELSGATITARRRIGTDGSSAVMNMKAHARVWLENARAFVDTPGEWHLDPDSGELVYQAAPGENPNQSRFSAPVLSELIVVRGTPEHPVRNLHFVNIEFAETDWTMPPEGRLGLQAGAWGLDGKRTYSPSAAVRLIYASGASLKYCAFRDLGEGAVSFEEGCSDGVVSRCDFRRVGANVIQVGRIPEYTGIGHPLHYDFPTFRDRLDEIKRIPGADDIYRQLMAVAPAGPARFLIADNTLVDCLHIDYGSVGIWVGYANHVDVEHNLLRNLPYTGINVGWRWAPGLTNCHSNRVEGNRVDACMRQAGDGAGIYLMGEQPGTRVIGNYVSDVRGNYSERGIYLDEFGDHMEIAGNYLTGIADRSINLHKNGPNQWLHDNNGDRGTTLLPERHTAGSRWVKYREERTPPEPGAYGPRPE